MRHAQATECWLSRRGRCARFAVFSICFIWSVVSLCPAFVSAQQSQLQQLAQIEAAIQRVARQNMDACVAIFDGSGIGSGVIVSPDGLVLTAGHVMSTDLPEYEVYFANGKSAMAKRLGRNLDVDSGMIQLQGNNWPHVKIGSSDAMKKGDWVVSLGHSGGFELGRKPPVR